jgi:hypothetical protein
MISSQILQIIAMLGIKSAPTSIEVQQLMIFLKSQFKANTFEDLKLGINLNAARKLDNYYQHYQLLNTDFVGAILTDYNELLRKASIEYQKAKELAIEQTTKLPEAKDSAYQFIKSYYQENKAFPEIANYSSAFKYAWDNNLTEDKDVMLTFFKSESESIKKEILERMFLAKNIIEKRVVELDLTNGFINLEARKRYLKKIIVYYESNRRI